MTPDKLAARISKHDTSGMGWYEPFLQDARKHGLAIAFVDGEDLWLVGRVCHKAPVWLGGCRFCLMGGQLAAETLMVGTVGGPLLTQDGVYEIRRAESGYVVLSVRGSQIRMETDTPHAYAGSVLVFSVT